jgi:SAM-dependent methyltransferase
MTTAPSDQADRARRDEASDQADRGRREEPFDPAIAYLAATRAAYDTVAASYAELLTDVEPNPLDRAMLTAFAESVLAGEGGPVADLGCGPGRITVHLRRLGLDAFGVDLSPGMVEQARARHPGLRFAVGSMTALDLADGALAGALAWYSTVHTPPEVLPAVFAEVRRVLAPGGLLLLAFKAGDLLRRLDRAYGHEGIRLDVHWTDPARTEELLTAAGLAVEARLVREPDERERPRQGRQAFLLARRPE